MSESKSTFVRQLWRQVALMQELSVQEQALQEAVRDREWEALQAIMRRMTETSEDLGRVETERISAYQSLADAADRDGNVEFSALLARLPEDLRSEISDAYRALKIAVLQLKSRTSGIDTYLRTTITTMRGVMRELYPEHATPVYSRDGSGAFTGGQALVVNHHL